MKKLLVFILPTVLFIPLITNAALVPCGKQGEGMCTLCDLVLGIHSLANYIISIMVVLAVLAITIGGIMYIVSIGNPSVMNMGKAAIKNALIGIAICLLAFLIISTIMNLLAQKNLGIERVGNWYTFECSPKK